MRAPVLVQQFTRLVYTPIAPIAFRENYEHDRKIQEKKHEMFLVYEMIWLSMTKEDGAGRYYANPQQARECTIYEIA